MGTSHRRTTSIHLSLVVMLLAAPLVVPLQVAADEPTSAAAQAKEEFFTAEAYYRKGDFKQAIVHYQRAYELKPHPSVLYNIAECYEKLGQFEPAAEHYGRYLADQPEAKDRAQVEAKIASFRALPSRVTITSTPPRAEVTINGEARGTTPLHLKLPPGEHTVEATYRDRGTQRRQVTCTYGRTLLVSFSFGAQVGHLEVRTSIDGVEVKIDGAVAGYTPFRGQLAPGPHEVDLTLYGYEPARREVVVTAGTVFTLTHRMRRLGGADTIDIQRDRANPWGTAGRSPSRSYRSRQRHQPPPPGVTTASPKPRARYILGALGGGHAAYIDDDQPGIGGLLLGIQSAHRVIDLEVEVLLPSPVVMDLLLRWYLTESSFRPFVTAGMLVVWRKDGTRDPATGTSNTTTKAIYGLGAGGGLALDITSNVTLFSQISFHALLSGDTSASDWRAYALIPITVGAYFKL